MNREQTKTYLEAAVKDFIDICPHCGAKAHFQLLFLEGQKEKNRDITYYLTFRCVPCKKLILETARFEQDKYRPEEKLEFQGWLDKFPTEDIVFLSRFEEVVPEDILVDFKEGVICLQNKCYRAAVAMFRRSLQSAMLNLGADPSKDLIEQITALTCLTTDIKDWAHNIRIFGNWGAHPQDDNLKDIDTEKASEAQSFLEEFFNYVYIMPSRVAKARETTDKSKVDKEQVTETSK
ncbi:MAG: DUF4145 domain-containing protein [Candidatus Paceibacterota bacterium]|jgi:hypothetical protein